MAGARCFFAHVACLRINVAHEPVQGRADQEQYAGNDRRRQDHVVMPGQIRLQRRREQPHLHDERQRDQRQRAVNGGQSVRADGVRSSISGFLLRFHSHRHDAIAAAFEHDAWQRTRRRALQHVTVLDREIAFVAGAFDPVLFAGVINGARQMRAFLAVGDVGIFIGSNQDARVVGLRASSAKAIAPATSSAAVPR